MIYRILTKENAPRLDNYLAEKCRLSVGLSKNKWRKIIELGGIHIDGRRSRKASQSVVSGSDIEIHLDTLPLTPFRLQEEHILFYDTFVIVINKPAGVLTQPTPARYKGTLYEALHHFLKTKGVKKPEIGMHQRLDVGTSGVLAFSIHKQAHKNLALQVQSKKLQRTYLAVVCGIPSTPSGTICSRLVRRYSDNRMVSVEKGGREAVTHYHIKDVFADFNCALLSVSLETGRSHQIRVHLSELGFPLLGDSFYGGKTSFGGLELSRPALHSSQLVMSHPIFGEQLRLAAGLPADFPFLSRINNI